MKPGFVYLKRSRKKQLRKAKTNQKKEKINKLLYTLLLISLLECVIVSGVSAASVYSVRADTADSLTAEGENRVVRRAKKEIFDQIFKEEKQSEKGSKE